MSDMSYEIDELLNVAIMTKEPIVIVEGIDDISIYSKLANKVPFDVEVYAIENIAGYSGGCGHVVSALKALYKLPEFNGQIKNHILGIVDKDVLDYRQEVKEFDSLLSLKYYSIESHFVSEYTLGELVSFCTRAAKEMLSQSDMQLIMEKVEQHLIEKLYYVSLEALKNSLEPEYAGDFSYSASAVGGMKNPQLQVKIEEKQADLDLFSNGLNLSPHFSSLLSISNGKWLLDVFAEFIVLEMRCLSAQCQNGIIKSCQYCSLEKFEQCLYRVKSGINNLAVTNFSKTCLDGGEFLYIIQRIKDIKEPEISEN